MPLFHLSAAPTVLAPMLVGGTSVLAAAFHPTEVWDEIRACGAAGFAGAGAMVSMLWNLPPDPRDADLPLRFLSAAPIAADIYRDIERRYGCRIVTMYGMTEAFPIAYKAVSEEGVPGTSGRVNPAFDVRIVDSHGKARTTGYGWGDRLPGAGNTCDERGVCVVGVRRARTAGRAAPGVVPHRRLGILDADQNLTYVDRVKDSLRRRGENVSSVEVETDRDAPSRRAGSRGGRHPQ